MREERARQLDKVEEAEAIFAKAKAPTTKTLAGWPKVETVKRGTKQADKPVEDVADAPRRVECQAGRRLRVREGRKPLHRKERF